MDSELLKAIGPFGKKFAATGSSASASSKPGFVFNTPRTAALGQPKLKLTSSAKSTVTPPVLKDKPLPKPPTNFEGFYKKSNAKFLQGPESRRDGRQAQMNMHRKEKRAETIMAKRKVNVQVTISPTTSTCGNKLQGATNSNENKVSSMSPLSPSTRSNNETTETKLGNQDSKIITNTRREQLQKWKKEKEAVENTLKASKKPAFKPNGPPLLPNKKVDNLIGFNLTNGVRSTARPNTAVKSNSSLLTKPSIQQTSENMQGNERRVTRAMAKAESVTKPYNDPAAKTAGVKPAIKGMKHLNLNDNVGTKAVEKSTLGGRPDNRMGQDKMVSVAKKTVLKPDVVSKDKPLLKSNMEISSTTTAKEKLVYLKMKPKGIDPVYIEHNANFAKACEMLGSLQKYWKDVLDTPFLPEEIRDDIISALGKVTLLLGSKLPQFGELLFSYLCKYENAGSGLILECDLQGWWDVASIQLERIQSEFGQLKELQMNNWERTPKSPEILQKLNSKSTTRASQGALKPVAIKPKVAKPSTGIHKFLAAQRELQRKQVNGGQSDEVKVEEAPKADGGDQPEVFNTMFEGGFFSINSPAKSTRTPNTRLSRRMTDRGFPPLAFSTPTTHSLPRRQSSVSSGNTILSVRKSMGNIFKIGAAPAFSDSQDENISETLEVVTDEPMDA